nr:C656 [uncultured bacterium]
MGAGRAAAAHVSEERIDDALPDRAAGGQHPPRLRVGTRWRPAGCFEQLLQGFPGNGLVQIRADRRATTHGFNDFQHSPPDRPGTGLAVYAPAALNLARSTQDHARGGLPMNRLTNKVAIITGASGGIGAAAARRFVAQGARVLLVDRDEAALQAVADGNAQMGCCVADVSQPEQMAACVQAAVQRFGGLDIAVLNAGIEGEVRPITDYDITTFDRVMAVNVRGVWLGLKYCIPAIARRGGGSIVITSSVAGLSGAENMSAYCASKHAVVGLMRTAAGECAPLNIRVNTVNPAPIETRMMRSLETGFLPGQPDAAKAFITQRIPMQRYGTPQEVADMMLFLASDESRYCTGGTYTVDGGMSCR